MNTTAPTLGQWIQRRRKALDLTQEELARCVPCATVTVQKMEADQRRPSRQTAARLAECLDVAPAQRSVWIEFARAPAGSAAQTALLQQLRPGSNLPILPTPLIGRESDIAAVRQRLLADDARLLTLVGPPGVGKTRLALEVGHALRDDFAAGVWFVDLAPITDPDLVAATIAQSLGALSTGCRSPRSHLLAYLQDRRLLLLLDNLEQVISAAGLVCDLLAASPWLKVLVTSRIALRVRGERQFHVTPLALPDLAHLPPTELLAQCPTMALFCERAQAVQPDLTLTEANAPALAAICCRLDGLPLAIELIAARSRVMSPQTLLSRLSGLLLRSDGLRDVPERQSTLEAAFGWSYDLLDPAEQALFRRLAVFRAGWTLEAAESVACDSGQLLAPTIARTQVLDLLTSLVHKSLVLRWTANGEPRFRMLETTGEYALTKLRACGEAELLKQRHAEHFQALAECAEPHFAGAHALQWLNRLEAERDNLRAALQWSLDTRQAGRAMRLGGALWRFWRKRGHASEGLNWLRRALELEPIAGTQAEGRALSLARAKALLGAGSLARVLGDHAGAQALLASSLALCRELGDEPGLAYALMMVGANAYDSGDWSAAHALFQRSLAVYRKLGDARGTGLILDILAELARDEGRLEQAEALLGEALHFKRECAEVYGMAWVLLDLGEVARIRGDYAGAADSLEQSLEMFRQIDDPETVAMTLHRLGELAWRQGQHECARSRLEESLKISREVGCKAEEAVALRVLGAIALAQDDSVRASELCEQSLSLCRQTGEQLGQAQALRVWGGAKLRQGDYAGAEDCFSESIAGLQRMRQRVDLPECLEGMAGVRAAQGRAAAAARLLAAARAMRAEMGMPEAGSMPKG